MSSLSKTFKLSGSRPVRGPKGKGSNGARTQSGKLTPALSCWPLRLSSQDEAAGESKSRGLLIFVTICIFVLPAWAKYEGGAGTAEDPYLI